MTSRVVIVRPAGAGHSAGGCCSAGRAGIVDDDRASHRSPGPDRDRAAEQAGACYLALRAALPDVDVQLVSAGNTAYLLPALYREARASAGVLASLRFAVRAPRPGAVLVDGEPVGDVARLGPEGVLRAVSSRVAPSSRRSGRP
jgi:hypothetical protein